MHANTAKNLNRSEGIGRDAGPIAPGPAAARAGGSPSGERDEPDFDTGRVTWSGATELAKKGGLPKPRASHHASLLTDGLKLKDIQLPKIRR